MQLKAIIADKKGEDLRSFMSPTSSSWIPLESTGIFEQIWQRKCQYSSGIHWNGISYRVTAGFHLFTGGIYASGFQWIPVDSSGFQWIPLESRGIQCNTIKIFYFIYSLV